MLTLSRILSFFYKFLFSIEFPVAKGAFKAKKSCGNLAKAINPALKKAAQKRAFKLAKY